MMSLAPGEFDEQTVLRSRVFLSATEQVLGDDPPRKPFNSLVASGRFGPGDVVADLATLSPAKSRAARPMTKSSSTNPRLALLDAGIGLDLSARPDPRPRHRDALRSTLGGACI